jgi:hypothetical protein
MPNTENRMRSTFSESETAALLGLARDEILVYAFVGVDGSLIIETKKGNTDARG